LTIRFETSPTEPDQPAPSAVTLRFDGERAAVRPIPFTGFCGTSFVVSFSGFNPFPTKEVTQPPPTMITLHLEGEQPELLPDLAGEISRLFRSEIRNGISGSADRVVQFVETALREVEQDLNIQEQRIRNTRREDDLPGGFPSGTAELGRLNDALRSNLEAQEHSSGRIAALLRTRGVEAAPSRGGAESSAATQRQLMIEAGEIYAELTDALDKLREEEGDLRTRIVVGRALDASPTNQNLIELTRRYEALQTTHRLILRTLEGASRASEFQSESVAKPLEVVRPPMTRRMKIWPDPLILAPSSIALGVSDALLFILWAEMRAPKRPRTDTHF